MARPGIFKRILGSFLRGKSFLMGNTWLSKLSGGQWLDTAYLEAYEKSLYVHACVSKIAQKVGSTEFTLHRIMNSTGETKEIMAHPLLDLLYRPNPYQTKAEFLEMVIINKKLSGNAFIWKLRNSSGKVVELWSLRPDKVTLVYGADGMVEKYRFAKDDGKFEDFLATDIIHDKYPSPLHTFLGVAPLRAAASRVDTEEYASRYQRDFFLNNARPDALLKVKDVSLDPSQKEEIRDSWEDRFKGVGKNSKLAIVEGNIEYQAMSITQREMDFIESMKATRDDILVAFQVPKPIVAITDDVNLANAKTAIEIFLSETIKPEVMRLVEKLNEELTYPDFDSAIYLDFEDPTPENIEIKLKQYETGIRSNFYLINEVRQWEGLPPIEGGWSFYMPFSNAPAGGLNAQGKSVGGFSKKAIADLQAAIVEKKEQAKGKVFKKRYWLHMRLEGKEELVKSFAEEGTKRLKEAAKATKDKRKRSKEESAPKGIFVEKEVRLKYIDFVNEKIDKRSKSLKSAVIKETNKQRERVMDKLAALAKSLKGKGKKKAFGTGDVNGLENYLTGEKEAEILQAFITPFIEEFLKSAGQEAMDIVAPGEEFEITEAIKKAIDKRAAYFAEVINQTTAEKISTALKAGIEAGEGITELGDRVQAVYEEFSTYRADMIARTETTAANNEGFVDAFEQSGVADYKEWIATQDDRTREEHLALDGEIVKLDDEFSNGLQYPEEPNCRCVVAPAFKP